MAAYTIEGLSFFYPGSAAPALCDLNLEVPRGQFLVLCGPSGSGKTTLLRHLKTALTPHGRVQGRIYFENRCLDEVDRREQSQRIGFVMQNPEQQVVTDQVWHELAFGLESLGYDSATIRLRVAETASFFGIQPWFHRDVDKLSGGQKQLLNLAAVMAMQPDVLLLDEPTSQLDPIAACDFISSLQRINREMGITVIMSEHRLEEALPAADRVIVMEEGAVIADDRPGEAGLSLKAGRHRMFSAWPVPMLIYSRVENSLDCPVTVREGRIWLDRLQAGGRLVNNRAAPQPVGATQSIPPGKAPFSPANAVKTRLALISAGRESSPPLIEFKAVWFKYERAAEDVLKGLSLSIAAGEFYALTGGNGTGKTTALSLLSGVNRPYRGSVRIGGHEVNLIPGEKLFSGLLGCLPQDPRLLFVKNTVSADLRALLAGRRLSRSEIERRLEQVNRLCRLESLQDRHPYDLSLGEQQRAALAKLLLLDPQILVLDEPTRGLDADAKGQLAAILQDLLANGATVFMVSHDIEFCARYASRCGLLFDGSLCSEGEPSSFFAGNGFYTTAASRMARHLLPAAVTADDVIIALGGRPLNDQPAFPDEYSGGGSDGSSDGSGGSGGSSGSSANSKDRDRRTRHIPRTGTAVAAMAEYPPGADQNSVPIPVAAGNICMCGEPARPLDQNFDPGPAPAGSRRPSLRGPSPRALTAALMILAAVPLTVWLGMELLDDRKYYFISLLVILETMLPFVLVFENRRPQARELVIIAVLCALGVAGRAIFFMLPQLKPVIAIVVISGVCLGGEAGFLVGAATALLSDCFFGQGPWTPWQMFGLGIIGFLAGALFKKGLLPRRRLPLCLFGALTAVIIYGGLMNPAAVLIFQPHPTVEMFWLAYIQGLPFDLAHAGATAFFLFIIAMPMIEKLERIKDKYGLIEP